MSACILSHFLDVTRINTAEIGVYEYASFSFPPTVVHTFLEERTRLTLTSCARLARKSFCSFNTPKHW